MSSYYDLIGNDAARDTGLFAYDYVRGMNVALDLSFDLNLTF
jgi:hypothetical protein